MSATNDGGPAFPNKDELGNMITGMSLRDWFAGQATLEESCEGLSLQTKEALAGRPFRGAIGPSTTAQDRIDVLTWHADWRARLKFIRADAMLRAREGGAK